MTVPTSQLSAATVEQRKKCLNNHLCLIFSFFYIYIIFITLGRFSVLPQPQVQQLGERGGAARDAHPDRPGVRRGLPLQRLHRPQPGGEQGHWSAGVDGR